MHVCTGEHNLIFAPQKKSAQGREVNTYKKKEGEKGGKEKNLKKRGKKNFKKRR